MLKQSNLPSVGYFFGSIIFLVLQGCSGLKVNAIAPSVSASEPAIPAGKQKDLKLEWKKRTEGLISDLSLSKDGTRIAVSTVPDPERKLSSDYHWFIFNHSGDLLFKQKMAGPTKHQALSSDGKWFFLLNYQEQLSAYFEGQLKWTVNAKCKPEWIPSTQKIICFYDDEEEAKAVQTVDKQFIAFRIYDLEGKLIQEVSQPDIALGLRSSLFGNWWALYRAGGSINFYTIQADGKLNSLWNQKLSTLATPQAAQVFEDEVIDLAISEGPNPVVAVLFFRSVARPQRWVRLYSWVGEVLAEQPVDFPATQIALTQVTGDSPSIWFYGNGPQGQILESYSMAQKKWLKGVSEKVSSAADNSFQMRSSEDAVWLGFEDFFDKQKRSQLVAFHANGAKMHQATFGKEWEEKVTREASGTYIYAYDISQSGENQVLGSDQATIYYFSTLK